MLVVGVLGTDVHVPRGQVRVIGTNLATVAVKWSRPVMTNPQLLTLLAKYIGCVLYPLSRLRSSVYHSRNWLNYQPCQPFESSLEKSTDSSLLSSLHWLRHQTSYPGKESIHDALASAHQSLSHVVHSLVLDFLSFLLKLFIVGSQS